MATPTLRALRESFPDARLVGLVRPSVAETIAGNPWLDQTVLFHHRSPDEKLRMLPIISRLRREAFDVAIILTNSLRGALLAYLGGAKRRVGYAHEGRGMFLNDSLPSPSGWKTAQQPPLVDYYLAIARHVGATARSNQLELFTLPEDEQHADRLWHKLGWEEQERVVVLNPGAAYGTAKRWPSRSFGELARRLVDDWKVKVLVLCGPSERGFARFIADASLRPRQVHSVAEEEVSLGLAKAVVKRSTLLVTTDSGPRHFGSAFGIPVVSLFGPTHIQWTDCHYESESTLQLKLPCGPCQQRECPLGHLRCMNELSVDMVYEAATRWLAAATLRQAG